MRQVFGFESFFPDAMKHPELVQPSVIFAGFTINEPITMFSDFLISTICLFAFIKILYSSQRGNNHYPILLFFFMMFFSTFWGGLVGHGLQHYLSPLWKIPSWLTGIFAVVAFQWIAANQLRKFKSKNLFRIILMLNLLSFLTAIYMVFALKVFVWVQFHAVFGILGIVLPIQIFIYSKTKSYCSRQLILGIVFAIVAALVHLFYLGLGKWFNHLDVSHVFLALSNLYFYFGLKKYAEEENAIFIPEYSKRN